MAGLKFVMTECSKTQIRLTRHIYIVGDVNTGIQYSEGHITLVVTPEQVKG